MLSRVGTTDDPRPVRAPTVAVLAGLVLGALTSYAQGWLPGALASLANSSGSWCLVAFLLALAATRRWAAALTGFLTLLMLLVGYVLAAAVRGFASSNSLLIFWGLAALVAGPVLGLAAQEVRRGGTTAAACGVAVMSGVLVGEGAYGLIVIADTTDPVYWWVSIVAGVVLLGWVGARRLRAVGPILLAVAVTVVLAVLFVAVYSRGFSILFG